MFGLLDVNLRSACAMILVHPDLIGLCALLLAYPFMGKSVSSRVAVSPHFAQVVADNLGKQFVRIDGSLQPQPSHSQQLGAPLLAYSGGADCTAAMLVMPSETRLVYLNRETPPELDGWSDYCSRAAVFSNEVATRAAEALRSAGRPVEIGASDLKYLRHPVGFPIDLACAAPAVLLADLLEGNSLGWGTVLESAYGIGRGAYIDYPGNYRRWHNVFKAVGLPFFIAVAGISGIETMRIANSARQADGLFFQSCSRSVNGAPCMQCPKCFRKEMLEGSVTGVWPGGAVLDRLFTSSLVARYTTAPKIKHGARLHTL